MSEPFVGEIRIFGYTFAPRSWAFCNGQLMAISQNQALFSLLGTTYGGDGRTTFGLPDLRGRIPIAPGTGPGLTTRRWGERSGQERVTLTTQQIPSHRHTLHGEDDAATTPNPAGVLPGEMPVTAYSNKTPNRAMAQAAVGLTGGNQGHENMMPNLAINFCIALYGIFPSRS